MPLEFVLSQALYSCQPSDWFAQFRRNVSHAAYPALFEALSFCASVFENNQTPHSSMRHSRCMSSASPNCDFSNTAVSLIRCLQSAFHFFKVMPSLVDCSAVPMILIKTVFQVRLGLHSLRSPAAAIAFASLISSSVGVSASILLAART